MVRPIKFNSGDPLRPFGENEAVRIIITPLGKKVMKQGFLLGAVLGVLTSGVIRAKARRSQVSA